MRGRIIRGRRHWPALGLALCVLLVQAGAGVQAGQPVTAPERASATPTDWLTFGYDVQRTGYNPNETTIGTSNASSLHPLWTHALATATIASPVFAHAVPVGAGSKDLLYAASRKNDISAIDAANGQTVWSRFIATDSLTTCNYARGISGSPAIDRAAGALYVVGTDDPTKKILVYGLNWSTGTTLPNWPLAISGNTPNEHVWSAVTLLGGTLYVEIGSCPEQMPYYGRIVAINTATAKISAIWLVNGPTTGWGSIWSYGGISADPVSGDVFVATGNGPPSNEHTAFSEHLVRLSSSLAVVSSSYPGLVGGDEDFASTPLLYQAPLCPPQLLVTNKTGEVFVYSRDAIASGPTQRLQISSPSSGAMLDYAAYSPAANTFYIVTPDDSPGVYKKGIVALHVQADCTLALAWQKQLGGHPDRTHPVVANGVVYFGDGLGKQVFALDASNGNVLWSATWANSAIYASPIVVNGRLYVVTYGLGSPRFGVVVAFGP